MGPRGPTKLALNQDGIDFAAVSLQPIPAGEYVPLLFTARNMSLETNGSGPELRGSYDVPSYRGATFMDPKVGREGGREGGRDCHSTVLSLRSLGPDRTPT
jgi:hypothetical protein